ncbi:PadR family transcriptional regulator [Aurantiacibacter odishensis]|uniref:PadR family transcriptional regulator n=1 Tax=Aurantiacibacter odishensis TaxID=1155476 RepID=UPI000E709B71|nr:PadR family transcriptional regulator [Aurantiacibacter odishensis]
MSKDSRKPRKSQAAGKSAKSSASRPRRARREEEIVEPEDLEPVEGDIEDHPEGEDFEVEVEIEMDDDDGDWEEGGPRRYRRRHRHRYNAEDVLGMAGIFGRDGPLGPDGPFGRGGVFGKDGVFGPGGLFAQSGGRKRSRSHQGEGQRRRRLFGPGELRLVLLAMLAEEPRHGYELIKALEDMTAGSYSPSPGTIYPTLQMLADEGAIAEQDSEDAKKLFQATESGLAELEDRKDEIEELWDRLGRKREKARPKGSSELFRAMGNLAQVIRNKAADGKLKDLDKEQVVDLIDELARKIERL